MPSPIIGETLNCDFLQYIKINGHTSPCIETFLFFGKPEQQNLFIKAILPLPDHIQNAYVPFRNPCRELYQP